MILPCRVCGVPTLNKTPKPKRCADLAAAINSEIMRE
jgi:hypothetical protein